MDSSSKEVGRSLRESAESSKPEMSMHYMENPLLFVNSHDSSVPQGRNVRTKARVEQARQQAPASAQKGQFSCFDFRPKRQADLDEGKGATKRRKTSIQGQSMITFSSTEPSEQTLANLLALTMAPHASPKMMSSDASEVLTVATFHIRRLAAMAIQTNPQRLAEVLRCRQWSCVSIPFDRFGKNPCLDSAFLCVESKLRQMIGGTISPMSVISCYTDALGKLHTALQDRDRLDLRDLMTATQLLAIYEMLDSLEDSSWTKHIAGAESLSNSKTSGPYLARKATTFAEAAPMFTDALLTANVEFFKTCKFPASPESMGRYAQSAFCIELLGYVFKVPGIMLATATLLKRPNHTDPQKTRDLLDQARTLRTRLRTTLLQSELYLHNGWSQSTTFDKLGLCLAGLVALDRLIASLRPLQQISPSPVEDSFNDRTDELCAQLLQLELGTADGAYPATDLMEAFQMSPYQQQGGFIIALPGRGY